MIREQWNIVKDQPIIYPKDLQEDPDKHGGMGMMMASAIRNKVVTIPLKQECCHVSIMVENLDDVKEIVKNGGVDVLAKGYWTRISSQKVVHRDTDIEVKQWQGIF
jgi:hypothetical protein